MFRGTPIKFLLLLLFVWPAQARHTPGVEKFSIFGQAEKLPTRPGAAHLIDEYELEKFDYLDVHQVLRSVPGVNIQEEDGFGLRPNIGLRGAHPHRSKKVTLMEDGVLIGPAPYSAPAAYYFPNTEKIYNYEIYKGPAAVKYGPNSIGGALNMVTRRHAQGAVFDLSYGQFNFQKYQLSAGFGDWSLDVVRTTHDGFKNLPNDQDTGFARHNVFLRWDKDLPNQQSVTVKVNWSNEDSRETYLGLTNDDFNVNPLDRYAASARDRMTWEHRQLFVNYQIEPNETYMFKATTYFHQFQRRWDKFDGFFDSTATIDVLRDPNSLANNDYYLVLTGRQNSTAFDNRDKIRITDNNRFYQSTGLQLLNRINLSSEYVDQEIEVGARLHGDEVNRTHDSQFFDMVGGELRQSNLASDRVVQNQFRALARTFYLNDTFSADSVEVSLGARYEDVDYQTLDYTNDALANPSESAWSYGGGMFYQLYSQGGLLAGVNKGITLVGPRDAGRANVEEAINYELGFRHSGAIGFELVGFYSDYSNIIGTCSVSSGCVQSDLDRQFDGGAADVLGVELLISGEAQWRGFRFPTRLSGTFTQAQFRDAFQSSFADWGSGQVNSGDPLPYIPELQGQLSTGVEYSKFRNFWNLNYVGAMADQAASVNRDTVPAYFVVNTSFQYQWTEDLLVMLRFDNLLNEQYAVSFRPFGVRPGRPFSAFVGVRLGI